MSLLAREMVGISQRGVNFSSMVYGIWPLFSTLSAETRAVHILLFIVQYNTLSDSRRQVQPVGRVSQLAPFLAGQWS